MANGPEPALRNPWLVAAWPGMGSVALAAASYLVAKLGGKQIQTVIKREFFDINTVQIESGVIQRSGPPKSTLHSVETPERDLLVFIGEAQPSHKGYEFCHEILDMALARGVRRLVTFAAMATPVHPSAAPRVFGVASDAGLLPLLSRHDVGVLQEGQISGLNGVLLGVAAERGLEGICLLGELPFFAVGIPNPKASLAVLRAFEKISGVEVDLGEIEEQAKMVERGLVELLERASKQQGGAEPEPTEELFKQAEEAVQEAQKAAERPAVAPAVRGKIEELFRLARVDRSQALQLKSLLDQHGIFRQYEDRFLDLFKKDQH